MNEGCTPCYVSEQQSEKESEKRKEKKRSRIQDSEMRVRRIAGSLQTRGSQRLPQHSQIQPDLLEGHELSSLLVLGLVHHPIGALSNLLHLLEHVHVRRAALEIEAPGAFPPVPSTPAAPSASSAHPCWAPPPRRPGFLRPVAPRAYPAPPARRTRPRPSSHPPPQPQPIPRNLSWREAVAQAVQEPPGPRKQLPQSQATERRRVQTSLAQHPPLPGSWPQGGRLPRGAALGGPGQLGAEVRGQEGLQKSQRRTRLCGQGEGLGPACLEMLGLLRAEPWQEWPPLRPGPLHPVLGHPPPAASPQALSPEFTRNPVILRPLCQAGRLLRGSPSWPLPALHHVHAKLSHTTRLYSQGHSGTLQDPHEAQRPSAPAPASEL